MDSTEFKSFAENYSKSDFDRIKFEWNGKHGDEFADPNYEFRNHLCEAIKDNFSEYSLDLIKDLYIEQAKCANETWSVYLGL